MPRADLGDLLAFFAVAREPGFIRAAPHRGIRDVPARRWAEMVERCPVNPVESIAQIDATLGRSRAATLSRQGVVFEHVRHGSDGLGVECL